MEKIANFLKHGSPIVFPSGKDTIQRPPKNKKKLNPLKKVALFATAILLTGATLTGCNPNFSNNNDFMKVPLPDKDSVTLVLDKNFVRTADSLMRTGMNEENSVKRALTTTRRDAFDKLRAEALGAWGSNNFSAIRRANNAESTITRDHCRELEERCFRETTYSVYGYQQGYSGNGEYHSYYGNSIGTIISYNEGSLDQIRSSVTEREQSKANTNEANANTNNNILASKIMKDNGR